MLKNTRNNVTTLTMNNPKKLNGWSGPMMLTLRDRSVVSSALYIWLPFLELVILENYPSESKSRVLYYFRFSECAQDPETKVLILTGADPYYCAGVDLSATIKPMHPKYVMMTFDKSSNTSPVKEASQPDS